jgi:hypothetical protein
MDQVERVVKLFPKAKFDSATTKTIELLPKDVKDDIFDREFIWKAKSDQ